MNYLPNRINGYIRRSRDVGEGLAKFSVAIPNILNKCIRELCKIIVFAMTWLSTFVVRVPLVFGGGSGEQVIRVATWWVIACMACVEVLLKWLSNLLFKDLSGRKFTASEAAAAILGGVFANPGPAFIGSAYVNAGPKLMISSSKSTGSTKYSLKSLLASALRACEVRLEHMLYFSRCVEGLQ